MLSATDLRNNSYFIYQEEPYKVLHYKHTHLSRRGADIKVKAKNLQNGAIKNFNFGSSDRFQEADIKKKELQFLYKQEDNFFFMDPNSYQQIELKKTVIKNKGNFLKEGEKVEVVLWKDKALDINLAPSVVLKVKDCPPGVKGNSATNVFKTASLGNGLKVKVPLFIKKGERIRVDTRSGEYLERVKE